MPQRVRVDVSGHSLGLDRHWNGGGHHGTSESVAHDMTIAVLTATAKLAAMLTHNLLMGTLHSGLGRLFLAPNLSPSPTRDCPAFSDFYSAFFIRTSHTSVATREHIGAKHKNEMIQHLTWSMSGDRSNLDQQPSSTPREQ